jgi:hypothetical protein
MIRRLCLTMVFAVICPSTPGVSQALHLGTVELTLGSPRQEVVELLGRYELRRLVDADDWVVMTADRAQVLGSVSFRRDSLVAAGRIWTPQFRAGDASHVEATHAIIGALRSLRSGGDGSCMLEDSSDQRPGFDTSSILIRCGSRHISLSVHRYQGQEIIGVQEFINLLDRETQ